MVLPTNSQSQSFASSSSSSFNLIKSVTLSRAARESGFEGLFWETYLPNSQFSSLFDDTQRALGGSISVIREIPSGNNLLRIALGAMALRAAAINNDDPGWMKQQATKLHVTALQQMRMALSSHRKHGLELLGAARVFSLYEALYGGDWRNQETQSRSWRVHHSGDLALIVSNPPSFYITGPAHRLFVDGRLNHVQCALSERKKLVLNEAAWMTIPWSHHRKTRKDFLIDILLEIPSLYEDIDNTILTQPSQRHNIQKRVSAVIGRLATWNSKFGVTLSSSVQDWRFPVSMSTDRIADAHIMTLYWATNLLAYSLYRDFSEEPDGMSIDADDCCRSIIHCIPVFLHPSTGAFRQHLVPFPLMAAALYLKAVQPPKLPTERDYLLSLCENSVFAPMHQFMSSLRPRILIGLEDNP